MFAAKIKLSKPLLVDMPRTIMRLFTRISLEFCDETSSVENAGLQHVLHFDSIFLGKCLSSELQFGKCEETGRCVCAEKCVSTLWVHLKEVTYHIVCHWPQIYQFRYKFVSLLSFRHFEKCESPKSKEITDYGMFPRTLSLLYKMTVQMQTVSFSYWSVCTC